jgi:PKD repeat protein/thiol-disulfide isomerase/thioredoxin
MLRQTTPSLILRLLSLLLLFQLIFQGVSSVHGLSLAPDFTLVDTEGNPFALNEFRGKVVLLDFMQTWCSHCIADVPQLIEVHDTLGDTLELISISLYNGDTDELLQQFKTDYNTTWTYARGPELRNTYNVTQTPTKFLIDANGYIRNQYVNEIDAAILIRDIEVLLPATLTLSTVPLLAPIRFRIDSQEYRTENGTLSVPLSRGIHQVELLDTTFSEGGVEYYFTQWQGSTVSSNNPVQINFTASSDLTAIFDPQDITSPSADAGLDQVVNEDTPVTLDGSLSTDNVGITEYTWTFVDGSVQTLTGIAPNYTFTTPGVYSVTLNVTDAAGNWATDTVTITVMDITPPIADAGISQTTHEALPFLFDASESVDNVGIVSYLWTFLDGTVQTLTGIAPNYTFTTPGVYSVTLNVTDAAGNWATDTIAITVTVEVPTADAGLDQEVEEDTVVMLNGSASWDALKAANYLWSFVDGTLQTLNGPNHEYTFTNPGVYTITLTIRDAFGTEATDSLQVTVLDVTQPIARIASDPAVTQGATLEFSAASSTDNGEIVQYAWDFGDDAQGTGITTNHVFANPGDYTVKLTITDAGGNIATTEQLVSVHPNGGEINVVMWLPILIIPGALLVFILKRIR